MHRTDVIWVNIKNRPFKRYNQLEQEAPLKDQSHFLAVAQIDGTNKMLRHHREIAEEWLRGRRNRNGFTFPLISICLQFVPIAIKIILSQSNVFNETNFCFVFMAPLRILNWPDIGDVQPRRNSAMHRFASQKFVSTTSTAVSCCPEQSKIPQSFQNCGHKNIYWANTTLLQTSKFGVYLWAVNFQLRYLVSHGQLRCLATCIIFGRIQ